MEARNHLTTCCSEGTKIMVSNQNFTGFLQEFNLYEIAWTRLNTEDMHSSKDNEL